MDSSLIFSIGFLLLIFSAVGGLIVKLWWDERNAARRRAAILAMGIEGENDDASHQPRRRRIQETDEDESNDEYPNNFEPIESDEKKIGKKKLAKLQAKAQAKAQREAEQAERMERKKQEEERERMEEEKRKAEEEEEQKRLEKLKAEREEKKRKEMEEYNKLKVAFSVEEQGFEQLDNEEYENLLQSFVDYIKESKVVYVDELSSKFSLTIDDTVERINQLIANKQINGVFDDRGKFIYITDDELKEVAKFINQRGRVSVQELVTYSNQLISLTPRETSEITVATVSS